MNVYLRVRRPVVAFAKMLRDNYSIAWVLLGLSAATLLAGLIMMLVLIFSSSPI